MDFNYVFFPDHLTCKCTLHKKMRHFCDIGLHNCNFLLDYNDLTLWGHFSHDISAHQQLITVVYWNDYTGRWKSRWLLLYKVPFEESWLRLNLNCNYEFEVFAFNCKMLINDKICLLMKMKIICLWWLTVGYWIMFVVFFKYNLSLI